MDMVEEQQEKIAHLQDTNRLMKKLARGGH
jgi:hypothetical protein